ncbi:thermonuclease family protein [Radiobacillus sp. PE A8.2]|uniref:thermonuclease family protein n=1 Tax=Radiobacillus sp. PE A8.2 TaxID=3380349 RepID=UPI003890EA83
MSKIIDKGSTLTVLAEQEIPGLDTATVTGVIDGDTIQVNVNGSEVDVRLLLIDSPEIAHYDNPTEPHGSDAIAFASRVLAGKTVQLEYDGPKYDTYGRLLAYVWVSGKMFNQMLLEEGLAHVAYVIDPPYKYYDKYLLAQTRGKNAVKGIWG